MPGLKPLPTRLVIAPRGYSWHGQKLQKNNNGKIVREPYRDSVPQVNPESTFSILPATSTKYADQEQK